METIEKKVTRIIAETLGVHAEKLLPETDLIKDLGADSLDVVEVSVNLEKEFCVTIPDERLEQMRKVGHFTDYFEKVKPFVMEDYYLRQVA